MTYMHHPACGCILTLKLREQAEEREKRCWTIPADYRNRNDAKVAVVHLAFEQGAIEFLRFQGEPPPEGYKVALPPPRESKKAKRKGTDGAENEGDVPKKVKLLSQAEQFLASTLPSKSTESRACGSGPSGQSRARPPASTLPVFLPRPGYVDPKPEPGELPAEPPTYQPEHVPVNTPLRWPTTQPPISKPARENLPPRPEPPLSYNHRDRSSGPDRPTSYDTREHGRYQYELGDARYDGPGLYGPDPYYAPPSAQHTEPWHARPPIPTYPEREEEDVYRRSYYDADYAHGYDYEYGYDYDYERDPYAAPPPPPPPAPVPAGPGGRGYADYERSGYDYDHGYARERTYTHPPPPTLPPPPQPAELTPGPGSAPRIWVPAQPPQPSVPPPPSPPRVWKPGPRAAEVDARRTGSGAREPQRLQSGELSESPSEPSLPRASDGALGAGMVPDPASASASVSSSSTPVHTVSASSKEELFGASNNQPVFGQSLFLQRANKPFSFFL